MLLEYHNTAIYNAISIERYSVCIGILKRNHNDGYSFQDKN